MVATVQVIERLPLGVSCTVRFWRDASLLEVLDTFGSVHASVGEAEDQLVVVVRALGEIGVPVVAAARPGPAVVLLEGRRP